MRRLALLDVDGTLTDTVAVDLECFLTTLSELFGFSSSERDYDWEAIPHATDPGLLEGAFHQFAKRSPTLAEADAFKTRFVRALERAAAESPAGFRSIAGARKLVAALAEAPDWDFAVATGCWAESARMKLAVAGFETVREPLASASEAVSREEIFGLALARSKSPDVGLAAVLVGDGTWDAVTAGNLDLPFVGVAAPRRAEDLRRLGAVEVLSDFRHLRTTLDVLEAAVGSKAGEC